jgi:hypothetical protein
MSFLLQSAQLRREARVVPSQLSQLTQARDQLDDRSLERQNVRHRWSGNLSVRSDSVEPLARA